MRKIIYHKNCKDGFAAAMVFWMAGGVEADTRYIPASYGDQCDLDSFQSDDCVFIVDFSYPRETLIQLNQRVHKLIVLDHHKTAEEGLKGLPFAYFNMEASGVRLAWEHVFGAFPPMPALFRRIEDRDLWKFKIPDTKQVCAGLDTLLMEFKVWEEHLHNLSELRTIGEGIERYNQKIINVALASAKLTTIDGIAVAVTNSAWLWSEIGEALCLAYQSAAYSAVWYQLDDGRIKWSLRSRPRVEDGFVFDVSEVAKRYGGGGHRAAAGFVSQAVNVVLPVKL